jgi:DNA-binding NtrC family response regulator
MDRAVLLTSGATVRSSALRLGRAAPRASSLGLEDGGMGYPATMPLAGVEAEHIRRVLAVTGGQIGQAAEVLGIHRNTLARKIREYGLDPSSGGGAT